MANLAKRLDDLEQREQAAGRVIVVVNGESEATYQAALDEAGPTGTVIRVLGGFQNSPAVVLLPDDGRGDR